RGAEANKKVKEKPQGPKHQPPHPPLKRRAGTCQSIAVRERQMTKSRNSTFRLKFVQAWADRDGRAHFYFRRAGYPRVRLPGLIGPAEFMAAYQAPRSAARRNLSA